MKQDELIIPAVISPAIITPAFFVDEDKDKEARMDILLNYKINQIAQLQTLISKQSYSANPTKTQIAPALKEDGSNQVLKSEELEIEISSNSLFVYDPATKHKRQLCNFLPIPEEQVLHIGKGGQVDVTIEIRVRTERGDKKISVAASQLDNVVAVIKKKIPTCFVNENISKAVPRVANYIRKQLHFAKSVECYTCTGWHNIYGKQYYLHDGLNGILGDTVLVHTGKRIECDQNISIDQSKRIALKVVNQLSSNLSKILPIFLFAHTSLLWSLFKEAGYPPLFLLFANGPTGSFKTAVCLQLFSYFNTDRIEIPANFKDTQTALETKMDQCTDAVMLLDDFHPSTNRNEAAQLESTLERMIRFYGDGIGKARGNISLNSVKELKPHGMCAITGEDTSGTNSSLLRCLMIDIEKNTFSPEELTWLQKNPFAWSTHIANFVTQVGENYAELTTLIENEFSRYRDAISHMFREKRSAQMATVLIITAHIVCTYLASEINKIDSTENTFITWRDTIINLVQQSEQSANTISLGEQFLIALFKQMQTGKVFVAPDMTTYRGDPNRYIGYVSDSNFWLLNPEKAFQIVTEYWTKYNTPFKCHPRGLYKSLEALGVITPQMECKKGSEKESKYFLYKTSLPGRPRFLKLYQPLAEKLADCEF